MAETYARRQLSVLERFVNPALQSVAAIVTVMAIVSVAFFPQIVGLLYPQQNAFLGGQSAFTILAVGFLFRGIGLAVASIFVSVGRPDVELKIALASLALGSAVGVALAMTGFGITGIAAGSAAGSVAIFALWMVFIPPVVGIRLQYRRLIVTPLLGLAIMATILGTAQVIPPWLSTLVLVGLLCVVAVRLYRFDQVLLRVERSIRLGEDR